MSILTLALMVPFWDEPKKAPSIQAKPPITQSSPTTKGFGPRPKAWCGWYMRTLKGVKDPSYNRARHWLNYGRPTHAQVGAIVVWPNHVGKLVGKDSKGSWLVHSGNDSKRVRTRARSIKGAIGFRI